MGNAHPTHDCKDLDDQTNIILGGSANQKPDTGIRKSPTSTVLNKIAPTEIGNTNFLRATQRDNSPEVVELAAIAERLKLKNKITTKISNAY